MTQDVRDGRCVLVTGGAGAIGAAITRRFLALGARVVIVDMNPEPLQDIRTGALEAIRGDATDPAVLAEAVATADRQGRLDTVVSTVGLHRPGSLTELAMDDWDAVVDASLTAGARCAREALPRLVENGGGSLTFIGSVHASVGAPRRAAYAAAKAGLTGLARQLAVDYGPLGVRSNVVSPGLIERPARPVEAQARRQLEAATPARRLGRPEDIAGAVAFLAGPDATFVNGIELTVDGGETAVLGLSLTHAPIGWTRPGPP